MLAGALLGNYCWHTGLLPCLYNLPHLDLREEPHQMFRKLFSSFFIKHNNVLWSDANVRVCSKHVLLVFEGCYILYDDTWGHKSHPQWCRVEDKTLCSSPLCLLLRSPCFSVSFQAASRWNLFNKQNPGVSLLHPICWGQVPSLSVLQSTDHAQPWARCFSLCRNASNNC